MTATTSAEPHSSCLTATTSAEPHSSCLTVTFVCCYCSGPQFHCIARANLRVQEVDETVRSHDLTLAGDEAKSDLPLFGQICCRLAAQPNVHLSEAVAGPVSVQVGTGGAALRFGWGLPVRGDQGLP